MTTEPFKQEENLLLLPSWMNMDKRLIAGFSTRLGGVSQEYFTSLNVGLHVSDNQDDVIYNRKIVASKINFDLENWILGEQVHDSKIEEVGKSSSGSGVYSLDDAILGVDGLYTRDKGVLLVSLYADCTPLYFYSKKDEMIGLAHAGWRGTVGEIGPKMIKLWTNDGVLLEDIKVIIGPSIGKDAYKVDTNVIEKVKQVLEPFEKCPYEEVESGQYLLDLKLLNYLLLRKVGLYDHQIEISQYCTAANTDLFFSHRKENGKTGRMMSFLGYRNK